MVQGLMTPSVNTQEELLFNEFAEGEEQQENDEADVEELSAEQQTSEQSEEGEDEDREVSQIDLDDRAEFSPNNNDPLMARFSSLSNNIEEWSRNLQASVQLPQVPDNENIQQNQSQAEE